jgi:hypothetical protein
VFFLHPIEFLKANGDLVNVVTADHWAWVAPGYERSPQVNGKELTEAEVWLLDVTHNAENLGTQTFSSEGTVTLPAQSATLYVIN